MKGPVKVLLIIAAIVVVAFMIFGKVMGWKNKLVMFDEGCKKAWAQVETTMQRRLDLIPNLVETVKGYAAHEESVLVDVTKARASVTGAGSPEEKMAANNQLSGALARLMVVVERYPDLKANQNFMALQDELAGTENRISVARQRYNDAVNEFNTTRRKFPYTLIAGSFKEAPYYAADVAAKEAPKVKF